MLQVDKGGDDGRVGGGKEKEVRTVAVLLTARQNWGEATDRIAFLGSAIRDGNQVLPASRPTNIPGGAWRKVLISTRGGRPGRSQSSGWVSRASYPCSRSHAPINSIGPRSDVPTSSRHRQSERYQLCTGGNEMRLE